MLAEAERTGTELPGVTAAVRLLVLTGCRLSEILTLRWEHVDFEAACLRLPDSKTGEQVVHLTAPALEVLAGLDRDGSPWVIRGAKGGAHLVNLEKPWRRLRARAGLQDVRLHDLRHSFASVAAGLGEGLPMIGKLLGHSQAQTTHRYAHLAADPVKAATERVGAALAVIHGIQPRDEIEAMLAAQMFATHRAAMDCLRAAQRAEQTFDGQEMNLKHATKLSRTFTAQMEALNRYRGKGQQKVTVEHVHIHHGGQAIVGHVQSGGPGGPGEKGKMRNNPRRLPMHLSPRCLARTRKGKPCRSPAVRRMRCRMHGGKSRGAPKGNKHAWKHGRYSAEAIAERRAVRQLLRQAKAILAEVRERI